MNNYEKKSVTIIGAGTRGLDIGLNLSEKGFLVTIIEKKNFVGGLSATINHEGYKLDIGPHYLSLPKNSPRIDEIRKLMGEDIIEIPIDVKIFFCGKLLNQYPTLYDVIFRFGIKFFVRGMSDYIISKITNLKKNTFSNTEEYCIATYGKFLYEVWFKPHIIRRYGNPNACSIKVAEKLFPKPNFKKIFHFLSKKSSHLNIKVDNSSDTFNFYFKNGIGTFPDKICDKITYNNGQIILNAEIISISHDKIKNITYKKNNKNFSHKSDLIIYGVSPTVALNWFSEIPPSIKQEIKKVTAFNSIITYIFIDAKKIYDGWIIDVFDPNLIFFRISQQNILSNGIAPNNKTVLCLETRCKKEDKIWNMEEGSIFELIKQDLKKIRLLTDQKIDGYKILKITNAYPILDIDENQESALEFINSFKNEYTIGKSMASPDTLVSSKRQKDNKTNEVKEVGLTSILSDTKKFVDVIVKDIEK
jgi:protoporphyrinogen oxidase